MAVEYELYRRLPGIVLGFHGCDESTGESILAAGEPTHLEQSKNLHDWLGSGIYFWENDPKRAREFAEEAILNTKLPAAPPTLPLPQPEPQAAPAEKELLRGTISKAQGITYRLMVTGELGSKEIAKLIKLLEAQKLVLEEDDETNLTFPPPRSSLPSNL